MQRQRASDPTPRFHNSDPVLHPFIRAREYQRALAATKLSRVFARPFLFALDGHRDGVCTMTTVNSTLVKVASGSMDGQIKMWNLQNQ